MAPTHALGAVTAWLAGVAVAGQFTEPLVPGTIVLGAGLAVVGGLAVDVDHERADAAQFARLAGLGVLTAAAVIGVSERGKPGAWELLAAAGMVLGLLPWVTRPHGGGYRGVVHSKWGLIFAALASFVPCLTGAWPVWAGAATMTGWVSHLALDALTKEGLRLNWPDQTRWGWLPKTQSMATGGPRRRRGKGRKGRRRVGLEYKLVQPVLCGCAAGSLVLILIGGHP